VVGVLVLALLASACGFGGDDADDQAAAPTVPSGGEATTDTITIGVQSLQDQFVDPHLTVGGLLLPLQWAISERLYRRDLDGTLGPNLATGYEISDDQLTWTFTLRDDVKMHDGSTFTARDVKTAIDRVLGSDAFAHASAFRSNVTGATVVDDTTVEVHTSKPFATLLDDMPVPIPTGYYEEVGEEGFRAHPMAAGAFRFVSQELNASVTYERFDDFFDEERKPNFENLVYEIIPDESSRVAGMRTGALDMTFGLTALAAEQLGREADIEIMESKDTATAWVMTLDNYFPEDPSPLLDVRVRKALLMAVDRQSIVDSLYRGYATVPAGGVPPVTLGYDDSLEPYPYDPEEAQRLLAEAGASGMSLTLNAYSATSSVPDFAKLAETIVGYWNQVGVDASLNIADANSILPAWRAHQLRGAGLIAGPSLSYAEPSGLGNPHYASNGSYTTLNDPEMDQLLARIDAAVDVDEREELGREFNEVLHRELYGLPIVLVSSLVAVGPDVASFELMRANPHAGPLWQLRAS
jgi:peptide/nickel transport system substrate-binding protein